MASTDIPRGGEGDHRTGRAPLLTNVLQYRPRVLDFDKREASNHDFVWHTGQNDVSTLRPPPRGAQTDYRTEQYRARVLNFDPANLATYHDYCWHKGDHTRDSDDKNLWQSKPKELTMTGTFIVAQPREPHQKRSPKDWSITKPLPTRDDLARTPLEFLCRREVLEHYVKRAKSAEHKRHTKAVSVVAPPTLARSTFSKPPESKMKRSRSASSATAYLKAIQSCSCTMSGSA
eukprot:gnl/TRDRNA2_/TRDRNA2_48643_c0_seq1.p1 gnl/TRDRNA2_/TRDRNA2_48643_c0~~gnl/TRDRNA2_/TRDRNA2_48643_c0_seq1.p1  ORF type:complete len:250 (-),score=20.00 gnl/TRDRNA2_/TRDRNA2_48643_c0_seq1:131-826(-)